jgi:hypothetical protein
MKRSLVIRRAAAGLAFVGAAALGYSYLYAKPRAALEKQLGSLRQANRALDQDLRDRRQVNQELRTLAASTLAATADQADARFRGALTALAKAAGVTVKLIDTKKPVEVTNPAGAARQLSSPPGLKTALKKQHDFAVIAGSLEATGTLEQVLRATVLVQSQPWIHRVDGFSIKPEGRERAMYSLKVGVETILLPDLAPRDLPDPEVRLVETSAHWAAIVQKNIFHEPAPEAIAAAPPAPAAPAAPAPPPYNDWKLTGVVESRLGIEAWLVNTRSGERRTLAAGAMLADAKFLSGAGERAVFEIGGQQYEVLNGQTLEQRRLTSR